MGAKRTLHHGCPMHAAADNQVLQLNQLMLSDNQVRPGSCLGRAQLLP